MEQLDSQIMPPPTLKRQSDVITVAGTPPTKRRLPQNYVDHQRLYDIFGTNNLNRVALQERMKTKGRNIPDLTLKYFRDNIHLKLFEGKPLDCYLTSNGSLAIFNFDPADVDILNELLCFLLKKFEINPIAFKPNEIEKKATQFIRVDRLSSFWDKECKLIGNLPSHAFVGKVNIKVIGLILQKPSAGGFSTSRLMIHVDQVKVEKELNSVASGAVQCVFD